MLTLLGSLHAMEINIEAKKEFKPVSGPVIVAISNDVLITGDSFGLVKTWDINTIKLLNEFQIHKKNEINSIAIKDDKVVTGSSDYSCTHDAVKIWNINTGEILHTLNSQGHTRSVAINDDKLVTSTENNLLPWNIKSGERIGIGKFTNTQIGSPFTRATITENKMVAGSYDKKTTVYDIETGKVLHVFEDDKRCYTTALTAAADDKIIIGLNDGRIKILDMKNNTILHTFVNM